MDTKYLKFLLCESYLLIFCTCSALTRTVLLALGMCPSHLTYANLPAHIARPPPPSVPLPGCHTQGHYLPDLITPKPGSR